MQFLHRCLLVTKVTVVASCVTAAALCTSCHQRVSVITGLLITGLDWNRKVCVYALWYAVQNCFRVCSDSSNLSILGHTSFMKQDTYWTWWTWKDHI